MKVKVWVAVSMGLIGLATSSDRADSQAALNEPEYMNQVSVLGNDGQLVPLEHEQQHHSIKRKNIPIIKVDLQGRQDIDGGAASPVHVGPAAHFAVRLGGEGQIDPTTLIRLVQLKVDKQGRYYVTSENSGYVFTNGKSTGPQGNATQLEVKKYGANSYEVVPAHPLAPGQYAFITNLAAADCFEVGSGVSDSAPAPKPAQRAAAPTPPPHPAATVVDLAPAAPGFPPMHASSAAQDGCWWVPFVSQRFGLEAAISHCETNSWAAVAAETSTGITLASPGSSSAPEQALTVETKPADQTLEAAIKQQFILKLKVPAARLSCRAQCETAGDGLSTCKVIATGPYSKLKKFNRDDDSSEDPCPGLMTNDAISTYFLARPSESKTKFILFSADDLGQTLNDATIHFLAQP